MLVLAAGMVTLSMLVMCKVEGTWPGEDST